MVGHSHEALRHEDCRGRLCICCGSKLSTSSVMSTSEEALVKEFRPHPAYDRSILSYPTGLCSTCRHSLYKIRAGTPVKAWGGPQPSSWAQFNIDTIFGVRTCGTKDQKGEVLMCDLCIHIWFNNVEKSTINIRILFSSSGQLGSLLLNHHYFYLVMRSFISLRRGATVHF